MAPEVTSVFGPDARLRHVDQIALEGNLRQAVFATNDFGDVEMTRGDRFRPGFLVRSEGFNVSVIVGPDGDQSNITTYDFTPISLTSDQDLKELRKNVDMMLKQCGPNTRKTGEQAESSMSAQEQTVVSQVNTLLGSLSTEEGLNAVLEELVERMGRDKAITRLTQSSRNPSREATIQDLIRDSGGIFIGREELVGLGKISSDLEIPPLPEKYSLEFFQSQHPLRKGSIASHVIVGFDPKSNQWVCIDRGSGGVDDVIPGSKGPRGRGLPGDKQDEIVAGVDVTGVQLRSPRDSSPCIEVISRAIKLLKGCPEERLPFYGVLGRTADTKNARPGCRVLIGFSLDYGTSPIGVLPSDDKQFTIGLLGAWD